MPAWAGHVPASWPPSWPLRGQQLSAPAHPSLTCGCALPALTCGCVPNSSSRYYNNLSYNYRDSDSIAAYYVADAVSAAGLAALQAQG